MFLSFIVFLLCVLEYYFHISRLLRRDDWYLWANMNSGKIVWPVFQSLEAFWPGLQVYLFLSFQ